MFFFLGMVESSRHNWSGLDKQTDIQNLNEERILALQLCGWIKKGTDVDVGPFLNSLVQEGEWERAAAVALFNLDIRRAIQIDLQFKRIHHMLSTDIGKRDSGLSLS